MRYRLTGFVIAFIGLGASARGESGPELPSYPDHERLLVVRDAAGGEAPVTSPTDWAVRRAHVLGHLQAVMGPLPGPERRVLLDVEVGEVVDEGSYLRKKVRFASEPGDRVPAWLLVPKDANARAPRAGVLSLHQTVRIGKDEPVGLGGKPSLHYAKELAERGHVVIAPDYPNFGEYTIDVYARGYASASMKAIWNNMRAVDLLQSLPEVDGRRIAAIGHSLGGHNAIFTAVFDERIKACVSSCGFNAFPYYYGGNIKGWSHKGYMPRLAETYGLDLKKVPFDFPELIGALAPRGFYTNSPLHDENFAVEGVRVCLNAARGAYRLFDAEGSLAAAHPDAPHDFPEEQRREAYAFIERVLGPGGP